MKKNRLGQFSSNDIHPNNRDGFYGIGMGCMSNSQILAMLKSGESFSSGSMGNSERMEMLSSNKLSSNNDIIQAKGELDGKDIHNASKRGSHGIGGKLPFQDQIQSSFGQFDISGITAHMGGRAKESCNKMGANAYASGNDVVFGASPNLHTAAHEAAHILQQKAGVSLNGGIGQSGDRYERHADAVADRVVQGRNAEDLLNKYAIPNKTGNEAQLQIQMDEIEGASTERGNSIDNLPPERIAKVNKENIANDTVYIPSKSNNNTVNHDSTNNKHVDPINNEQDETLNNDLNDSIGKDNNDNCWDLPNGEQGTDETEEGIDDLLERMEEPPKER